MFSYTLGWLYAVFACFARVLDRWIDRKIGGEVGHAQLWGVLDCFGTCGPTRSKVPKLENALPVPLLRQVYIFICIYTYILVYIYI